MEPVNASSIVATNHIRYSICTLVTRPSQYAEMLESFRARGFAGPDVEYIYLDNAKSNQYDAYSGINLFLSIARGKYIIVCHQDILLLDDDMKALDAVLADLESKDPNWAVCGNAGGIHPGRLALRISDPYGEDSRTDNYPVRVDSLDENFIVIRRDANLSLSRDLTGFHMYGADICIIADVLGWTSYVVDFHLRHLSPGTKDRTLMESRAALIRKYSRAFRPRWVTTTCVSFLLGAGEAVGGVVNSRLITKIVVKAGKIFAGAKAQ